MADFNVKDAKERLEEIVLELNRGDNATWQQVDSLNLIASEALARIEELQASVKIVRELRMYADSLPNLGRGSEYDDPKSFAHGYDEAIRQVRATMEGKLLSRRIVVGLDGITALDGENPSSKGPQHDPGKFEEALAKLERIRGSHYVDILIRKDGQTIWIEGDFLKNLLPYRSTPGEDLKDSVHPSESTKGRRTDDL